MINYLIALSCPQTLMVLCLCVMDRTSTIHHQLEGHTRTSAVFCNYKFLLPSAMSHLFNKTFLSRPGAD